MSRPRTKQLNIDTPLPLPIHLVAGLPTATVAGEMIFVSDEVNGPVPAFWDAVTLDWRRVTDRQVVS